MKKTLIFTTLLLATSFATAVFSQNISFSAGIGALGLDGKALTEDVTFVNFGSTVIRKGSSTIPFFIKGEFKLSEKFGLGLNTFFYNSKGFVSTRFQSLPNLPTSLSITDRNSKFFGFDFRFNAYPVHTAQFEVYTGLGLGFVNEKFTSSNTFTSINNTQTFQSNSSEPRYSTEASAGMRYFFIKNLGVFVELGVLSRFEKTNFAYQVGLTSRF